MDTILQRLTDLDDVSGAILVGKDGLIVTGTLQSEDEEVIGAISAAAFGSITSFIDQINHGNLGKQGTMHHVIIETQNGTIQFEEVGDLILVVTTQHGTNLGRIRIEMKKACRQIQQLVASY
jgi:predicted regulator of Ras-like GTPase activity (Roadblock/LC7/MglB family)